MSISICVSMLDDDFLSHGENVARAYARFDNLAIDWFILVQTFKSKEELRIPKQLLNKVMVSNSLGLSESRNQCLSFCRTNYCIFADYDVFYDANSILKATEFLQSYAQLPFGIINLHKPRDQKKDSVNYTPRNNMKQGDVRVVNSPNMLSRVFTPQIIWNVDFLKSSKLIFDKNLGLKPGKKILFFGEEYLLTLNCFILGKQFLLINVDCGYITKPSTGDKLNLLQKIITFCYVMMVVKNLSPRQKIIFIFERIKSTKLYNSFKKRFLH